MTQNTSLFRLAIAASATLAAERFIVATGAYATAAGNAIGVTATSAESGDMVGTDVLGSAVITAGGAFDAGDYIQVGTSGKGVVQASGIAVAVALQAATADGDRVEVLLIPNAPAGA